jgi:hypothetical protein
MTLAPTGVPLYVVVLLTRCPGLNTTVPGAFAPIGVVSLCAGAEKESVVRTSSTRGLFLATPMQSGTGVPIVVWFFVGIRRNTPGGMISSG